MSWESHFVLLSLASLSYRVKRKPALYTAAMMIQSEKTLQLIQHYINESYYIFNSTQTPTSIQKEEKNKFTSNFPINLGGRSLLTSFSIITLFIALQEPEYGK